MKKNICKTLNKIFTRYSLKKIINDPYNNKNYVAAIKYFSLDKRDMTHKQVLEFLYNYMIKNYRNEYVYKNIIFNKYILGIHSIRTSSAIKELPINTDNNILDLLLICNHDANVYEIKTELDNLERLESQINSYYKAFSKCYVITDESHLKGVKELLNEGYGYVGILVLNRNNHITTFRDAREHKQDLDYKVIFNILRKYEFEQIIIDKGYNLPHGSDFTYYNDCFNILKSINLDDFQQAMIDKLNNRSSINKNNLSSFNKIPKSINYLIYFSKYKEKDFEKLNCFLNNKIREDDLT